MATKKAASIDLTFEPERETSNTWRFQERTEDDAEPLIGNLYVRKSTLSQLGWDEENPLVVIIKAD